MFSPERVVSFIKVGLVAALLIAPVLFNPWSPYPTVTLQVTGFQAIIEITFALWLVLAITNRAYRPRWTPLTVTLSIFIIVLGITSLSGTNFYRSLWGVADRKIGLIALIHFYTFFIMLSSLHKKISFEFFSKIAVGIGLLLSIAAIAQHLNPLAFLWFGGSGDRPGGLLANAPFLAGYLIFGLFFSIRLALAAQTIKERWAFAFTSIFFAGVILFITQTRGATVGMIFGILVWICIEIFFTENTWRVNAYEWRWLLIAFAGIVAIACVIISLPVGKDIPGINRFLSQSTKENLNQRLVLWKVGWQGFIEHPILGWGIGNFETVFNKFYDPNIYTETTFVFPGPPDKPYNVLVEWLVSSGLIGLISYTALFVAVCYSLFRAKARQASVLIALLGAYVVQNLVLFDTIATYPVFFFLLALIDHEFKDTDDADQEPEGTEERRHHTILTGTLLILAAITIIVYVNFNTLRAEARAYAGNFAMMKTNNADTADQEYGQALEIPNPYQNDTALNFARDVRFGHMRTVSAADWESIFLRAARALEKASQTIPNDVAYKIGLAELYNEYASHHAAFIESALISETEALVLAPQNYQLYLAMAKTALLTGNRDTALSDLVKAHSLNPALEEPRVMLARFYYEIEEWEKSNVEIEEMLKQPLLPKYANEYYVFGSVKSARGDYKSAITFYIQALSAPFTDLDPLPDELLVNIKLNLALNYYWSGDKEAARSVLDIITKELRERSELRSYNAFEAIMKALRLDVAP